MLEGQQNLSSLNVYWKFELHSQHQQVDFWSPAFRLRDNRIHTLLNSSRCAVAASPGPNSPLRLWRYCCCFSLSITTPPPLPHSLLLFHAPLLLWAAPLLSFYGGTGRSLLLSNRRLKIFSLRSFVGNKNNAPRQTATTCSKALEGRREGEKKGLGEERGSVS